MSEKPSFPWTLKYTLLNVAYFAAFCTVHAYAAVFLLANGFNNTEVGALLALSNIVSAILQPIVAGIIDRPGPLTNRKFILFSVLVIMAGSVILNFIPGNKIMIFVVYVIIYMIQFVYQPVMTALCFAHNMINDFMIQIIRHLGGNETELGYSNFLQAILELPVMALIGIVLKKITADKLLIISGVAFFIKILILVFGGNMAHMYLSQSFQLFAYAVFIPAGAY